MRSTDAATPTVLERHAYSYDTASNRVGEQIDDAPRESLYDADNQLLLQRPGGNLRVAGTLSEPAMVTIDGIAATVSADAKFSGAIDVPTGTSTISIVARDASQNTTTATYEVSAVGASTSWTHDANGNVSFGRRSLIRLGRGQPLGRGVGAWTTAGDHDIRWPGAARPVRARNRSARLCV